LDYVCYMIKQKKKLCVECGKEAYIFSKGRCKSCTPNKSIKKSYNHIKKISEKGIERQKIKTENTKKLHEFMYQWYLKQNPKQCWACNTQLYGEFSTAWVDHLLMKSKHKDLEFEENNFFLCCLSCHSLKENGFPKPKHLEAINKVKEKYG
jgi:ribosomal protein L37E